MIATGAAFPQTVSSKETSLHATGRKTVTAIAFGDVAYIASITDPQGIYVGYDDVKHTKQDFLNDLQSHLGPYCELFDVACKTSHNPKYTLANALKPQVLNADMRFKVDKDNGTLDYIERGGGDLIATFSFRFSGGKWFLYNIHFV